MVQYPHPALSAKCPPVTDPREPALLQTAADLLATVVTQDAMGLAAPQLGVSHRVFVVRKPFLRNDAEARAYLKKRLGRRIVKAGNEEEESRPLEFIPCIDPKILSHKDSTELGIEACLSFPDLATLVRRYSDITVSYTHGHTGVLVEERLSGLPAVVFQHELDHLDGVLLTDREVKTFLRRSREEEFDLAQEKFMLGLIKYYHVQRPDQALKGEMD